MRKIFSHPILLLAVVALSGCVANEYSNSIPSSSNQENRNIGSSLSGLSGRSKFGHSTYGYSGNSYSRNGLSRRSTFGRSAYGNFNGALSSSKSLDLDSSKSQDLASTNSLDLGSTNSLDLSSTNSPYRNRGDRISGRSKFGHSTYGYSGTRYSSYGARGGLHGYSTFGGRKGFSNFYRSGVSDIFGSYEDDRY